VIYMCVVFDVRICVCEICLMCVCNMCVNVMFV